MWNLNVYVHTKIVFISDKENASITMKKKLTWNLAVSPQTFRLVVTQSKTSAGKQMD